MKSQKLYIKFTLIVSILIGIIMPLLIGIKSTKIIAICFSFVWFIYAVIFFVSTFLINGQRAKKQLSSEDSISLRDIQEIQSLYEITIGKENEIPKGKLWS